jgi:hypothetical protein
VREVKVADKAGQNIEGVFPRDSSANLLLVQFLKAGDFFPIGSGQVHTAHIEAAPSSLEQKATPESNRGATGEK